MKTNILVSGLVLATVGAVLIYPTIRGNATGTARTDPTNVIAPVAATRVEVVFVLDTTGSRGLIHAAKEKIWSIASTLAQAQQAPEISMGLVAYRDRGDAYVTRVIDLNKDLDSMYAQLMDFAADGGGDGPEAVNEALEAAIHRMSWSQDQGAYKVVFLVGDAPPHMDYQDDVKYPQVVAAAAAKGIVVNTIQAGAMTETVAPWQHIASLGRGRYFTVEQAGSAVAIATPFDARIATLAAELDGTRLYYGSTEERAAMDRKVEATARLNEEASVGALARRGAFNASASGAANFLGGKELWTTWRAARGSRRRAAQPRCLRRWPRCRPRSRAPSSRRPKNVGSYKQIAELRGGNAFIEAEVKATGRAGDSLDQQIYDAVREQAAPLG
jgi:uncharacterized protein YegL